MTTRKKIGWRELSPTQRRVVLVLGVLQVTIAALAWTDLARRPREQIAGSKRGWALGICVNFIGPAAYFVFGRRSADSDRSTRR